MQGQNPFIRALNKNKTINEPSISIVYRTPQCTKIYKHFVNKEAGLYDIRMNSSYKKSMSDYFYNYSKRMCYTSALHYIIKYTHYSLNSNIDLITTNQITANLF